jgi:hypothetical protein
VFVLFVRHAHVANPVFDNIVKDVLVVHEGHLFVLLGYLFEQDSRDGREVTSSLRAILFVVFRTIKYYIARKEPNIKLEGM